MSAYTIRRGKDVKINEENSFTSKNNNYQEINNLNYEHSTVEIIHFKKTAPHIDIKIKYLLY